MCLEDKQILFEPGIKKYEIKKENSLQMAGYIKLLITKLSENSTISWHSVCFIKRHCGNLIKIYVIDVKFIFC